MGWELGVLVAVMFAFALGFACAFAFAHAFFFAFSSVLGFAFAFADHRMTAELKGSPGENGVEELCLCCVLTN